MANAIERTEARLRERLRAGEGLGRTWVGALLVMSALAVPYGGTIGIWAPRLALYTAIKFPLVLLLTVFLTLPFAWVSARAFGLTGGIGRIGVLTTLPLAVSTLILASLVPVVLLFTQSAPPALPENQTAHNLLYLLHVTFVGGAGTVGTLRLRGLLAAVLPDPSRAGRLAATWVALYAFVGGEVAWALRPFVGSPWHPVEFVRADAFDGNVYEFIFRAIVPYLLGLEGELS